jgi:hypothetical protein
MDRLSLEADFPSLRHDPVNAEDFRHELWTWLFLDCRWTRRTREFLGRIRFLIPSIWGDTFHKEDFFTELAPLLEPTIESCSVNAERIIFELEAKFPADLEELGGRRKAKRLFERIERSQEAVLAKGVP